MTVLSVVIPAHNEEEHLPGCLEAVRLAAANVDVEVEAVVVLNRCTDGTGDIARAAGATCVEDTARCLSATRNKGLVAASGDLLVTCDADSRIHERMLERVVVELSTGAVGGGVDVRHDRRSAGIALTEWVLRTGVRLTGVSCGAFWLTRDGFRGVGGFDERLPMGEDVDFGKRLRAWGRRNGLQYRTLWDTPVTTSSRKFDAYGDWLFFRLLAQPLRIRRSLKGQDTEFVDEYFYDFNDHA